jgi:hypothetical protein
MPTTELWILGYSANVLFWAWVIWWGGAEWLEGTFTSGFLISWLAPRWSADGIKLFGWLSLLVTSVGFVVGLFVPELRCWPREC